MKYTDIDFNNKTIKTIEKSQFKFGYRDGDFLKNYLILSGKFQFLKSNKDDIYKIMSELNTKRKSSISSNSNRFSWICWKIIYSEILLVIKARMMWNWNGILGSERKRGRGKWREMKWRYDKKYWEKDRI